MIVEFVVLNRIDEAKSQRPIGLLCQLEELGNGFTPMKKRGIAEFLVRAFLRETVGIDNRRAVH